MRRAAATFLILSLALGPAVATPRTVTADEAMAAAQGAYGAETVSRACRAEPGEIVVCADRGEDQLVFGPSTSTDNGIPDAPDLAPKGAGGVSVSGCFLQKCPKAQYFVDVAALPKAAEGTDADRIAKGEMRGN